MVLGGRLDLALQCNNWSTLMFFLGQGPEGLVTANRHSGSVNPSLFGTAIRLGVPPVWKLGSQVGPVFIILLLLKPSKGFRML